MKKLMLLAAAGIGYVLGAKAGRGRYEQIASTFTKVKEDPRVQQATATVSEKAKEQAPVVKEKASAAASSAASAAKDKVSGNGKDDELVEQLHPKSTARQEDPYPQGDLP